NFPSQVLKAGLEGLKENLKAPPACEINTYENEKLFEKLPKNLEEALEELKRDKLIRETLGKAFPIFLKFKEKEWLEYKKIYPTWNPFEITEWEFKKYFHQI
ncbi:glutamine synthetase, partial [Candidatus Bathyarchaeota archaeon]|nr:glutamine synthetase [Candidatus Bathyarchaeota archaeon]